MLKQTIKKGVYQVAAVHDEKIILQQIADKAAVSFDVFDTAVKRDVFSPTDVFTLMEDILKAEGGDTSTDFAKLRVAAEKKAHSLNGEREVTLEEIYAQMPLDAERRHHLMQLECETEVAVSTPNNFIKRVYDICVLQGKKILFISDMYLPCEIIGEILRKNGYTQGKLYVSSENGQTKHSGKLFRYVQQTENLPVKEWIHIGDAVASDYWVPKRLGLGAILIEREPRCNKYVYKKLYRKNQSYRQLNHFIDAHVTRYTDPYEQIGYAILGPLLYGFSCWLEKEIPKDESIVFLAREGELLQKAFRIVSERPSVYLRVSRHALNVVYIDYAENVEKLLELRVNPLKQFAEQAVWAKMYGLSDENIETLIQRGEMDKNGTVSDEATKSKLLRTIWPTARNNAKGQYDLFQSYIKQLGIGEKASVIDVGWRGTVQTMLSNLDLKSNGRPICWRGYYFGIHKGGNESPVNSCVKNAYLYDGKSKAHIQESVINSVQVFDGLFLSTDGTTKGYQVIEGKACPVLGIPENNKRVSKDISAMQEAGIAFVRDYFESPVGKADGINAEIAAANYEALARVPTLDTIKLFEQFAYYDEKTVSFKAKTSLGQYLCHPKQLIADFAETGNRSWFLKSLFKLPLPYIAMINFARKVTEKKKF